MPFAKARGVGVASRALRVLVFVSLNCLRIITPFHLIFKLSAFKKCFLPAPNCLFGVASPYSPRGFHRARARRIE